MTKVVFRESLVMQKMSGSGCVGGSCLGTHLQADFAPISENEAKTGTRDRARRARTGTRGYQAEFSSCVFGRRKTDANGNPIFW